MHWLFEAKKGYGLDAVVKTERARGYEISRIDRFRYGTRYFTDSGPPA